MFPSILPPVVLIFCTAFAMHIACTAPAAPKERRMSNDITTMISVPSMNLYRYICWIHGAVEILLLTLPIIVRHFLHSTTILGIYQSFTSLPASHGKDVEIFFPPLRLIGAFLVVSGSIMRYSCYRELGRHFTLHVAVLDNHKLVTTGPYSIVRHPAYSGAILTFGGSPLWHATSGSWLVQSGLGAKPIVWIMLLPAIIVTIATVIIAIVTRPGEEDELLKNQFGKKWDEWQKRVPYRLIPGIY